MNDLAISKDYISNVGFAISRSTFVRTNSRDQYFQLVMEYTILIFNKPIRIATGKSQLGGLHAIEINKKYGSQNPCAQIHLGSVQVHYNNRKHQGTNEGTNCLKSDKTISTIDEEIRFKSYQQLKWSSKRWIILSDNGRDEFVTILNRQ